MAADSGKLEDGFRDARNYAKDLSDILANQVAGNAKTTKDLVYQINSELKNTTDNSSQLNTLVQSRNSYLQQQVKLGLFVNKGLVNQLDSQIALLEKKIEQEQIDEDIKAIQKAHIDQANALKDKMQGVLNTMSAIATNPTVAIGAGLAYIAAQAFEFGKEMFSASKSMGLGVEQSAQLAESTAAAAASAKLFGGSTSDAVQAANALTSEAGALNNLTADAVNNATFLSVRFGLGAENAAKLQTVMKDVTDGTIEGSKSMQDFATDLAIANNVAPGAVMQDIAANTEMFAQSGAEGAKEFIKTSIAAKKLGIEISAINAAAGSLLDIEGSMSKQMEAEVLLGRQLNLDGARRAANQGDYLSLTKELTKNVGTLDDFEGMSVIKRQALADALGMSVSDTRKMVANQSKLADLSETALEHYKETGEIQHEGKSVLNEQNIQMAQSGIMAAAALGSLASQLGLRTSIFGMAKATAAVDSGKGDSGKGGGGFMKMIGNLNPMSLIKGAAAMVIVAGAVFVFGKAVQEFMKVSWTAVGMAVVSMLALTGAVALLGVIMSSGVGAVAIIAGAAAMVIVAAAVYVLGKALQEMATAFDMMLPMTESLMSLVMIIPGLVALASTFGLLSVGIATMAASLLVLTPVLPALLALGSLAPVVGALTGNASSDSPAATSSSDSVIEKLDELITVVKAGGTINLDGRKVGDVLTLARAPIGV
jgi:hypothetical protein